MTAEHEMPNVPPAQERQAATPLRRTINWLLRLLVYLPTCLLLLLALLVGTGPGSHLAIKLADWLVPDLQLSYQSGTLNDKLELQQAAWQMPGISVHSGHLLLQWRPACLLQAQLCVDELQMDGATVSVITAQLADATAASTTTTNNQLQLPFGIQLRAARLAQVQVQVNDMHFSGSELTLAATWQKSGLLVESLQTQGIQVIIPSAAKDTNSDPSWPLAQLPEVTMPFPLNIQSALLTDSTLIMGERQDKFSRLDLQGSFYGQHLALQHLQLNHDYGDGQFDGDITLAGRYPLTLHAQLQIQQLPQLPGLQSQQLTAALTGDFRHLQAELQLNGEQQAAINGHIDLTNAALPYDITVEHGKLHWPLTEPQYAVAGLTLHSNGSLQQQTATISGNFDTPWLSQIDITADVSHKPQQLDIAAFKAWSAAGQLTLQGSLDYANGIKWRAKVGVEELNAAKIALTTDDVTIPESSISGSFNTHGHVADKQWQVAIAAANLQGSAAKTPFALTGSADVDQRWHLHSKGLQLTAFNAALSLDGNAGEKWDLNGKLTVPELAMFYPQAHGSINADITVRGDGSHPQLLLDGSAAQLSFKDYELQSAQVNGRYTPLDQHAFSLQLQAHALTLSHQQLDSLTLVADGDLNQQQLTLSSQGPQSISLTLNNRYDQQKKLVSAQLEQLQLNTNIGRWQLQHPASFRWDLQKQQGQVAPLCLQTDRNLLCLQQPVTIADKGVATLHYTGEPGELLTNLLPEGVLWQGKADMDASVSWSPKMKPTAQLQFNIAPGRISFPEGRDSPAPIDFDGGFIKAKLDQQSLTTQVEFTAGDILQLHSQLNIGVSPTHPLQGSIKMQQINLKPLQRLVPQLQTLQGLVNADIAIAGSLQDPQFSGQLQLKDGELVSTTNPTKIEQLQLQLAFAGQHATLQGNWKMGDGNGEMQGDIRWTDGQFEGDLALNGKALTLIQPPLAILKVSPNLQLHFAPKRLDVKGSVDIPSGNISIMQLPDGGVGVSQDVVFDDSVAQIQARAAPMAISADIGLNVGNKVAIDGYGLKGMLSGTLRLQQQANKPVQLFGNIRVLDGSYRFMGQTLSITTGELQFAGPPQVPNLNVEAIREIKDDDVVAGVRVTGTPQKPVVTLFSNPAKEQAEILSYIVQGKGYDSSQNNSLMLGAAMALSGQVTGGGQALSNIGNTAAGLVEKFGFSNVQLDTNDDGKVAISGYLGKDLMLKYGVGVFNPGYEMTVRYYLLSKLYLESVTSTVGQSLDIYYSFDL
ncbi:translocation/assembly module TamB [Shewanella sp. 4t3-1-2LB]|uniref:autotransporter assembly complex protein TamB n=1 Tax=Shewanella sp. 4t3-1-2LB TaxID=2817682 RepID=UPI001A9A16F7|nr:translocation/assembly module TamB domain-containing protein [Shewanella sp. 4t3-1-2LB]MBO1270180.1 translocation/assembly module TamB [Shewanella sp. 4t3-1-2LB]